MTNLSQASGTAAASLSTFSTVESMTGMFITLLSAKFASLGANFTEFGTEIRSPSDKTDTHSTEIGTVTAKSDTSGHHLHHVSTQAVIGTSFTGSQTIQAILKAFIHSCSCHLHLVVNHEENQFKKVGSIIIVLISIIYEPLILVPTSNRILEVK